MTAAMENDLLALAAKIEVLDGPSRDIDAEIAKAIGMTVCPEPSRSTARVYGFGIPRRNKRNLPQFTGSSDAAVNIAPTGMGISVQRYWIASRAGSVWSAELMAGGTPDRPREVFDCFDTPNAAIAISAAALRARASQFQSEVSNG